MKRLAWLLAITPLFAWSESTHTEQTCRLEDGSTVALQSQSSVDGKRLFLTLDGRTEPAFSDMPSTDFVGELAMVTCTSGALVFALNYGPPYLKGVAIRRRPHDQHIERIDFAEKSLPAWLYLGRNGMQLVMPNQGNEVSGKYIVYRYAMPGGQPDAATGANTLPARRGYHAVRLP